MVVSHFLFWELKNGFYSWNFFFPRRGKWGLPACITPLDKGCCTCVAAVSDLRCSLLCVTSDIKLMWRIQMKESPLLQAWALLLEVEGQALQQGLWQTSKMTKLLSAFWLSLYFSHHNVSPEYTGTTVMGASVFNCQMLQKLFEGGDREGSKMIESLKKRKSLQTFSMYWYSSRQWRCNEGEGLKRNYYHA